MFQSSHNRHHRSILFGVLAAIALPAYQDYISKSQTTRVVGELAAGKTAVDAALFEGKAPALKDAPATGNTKAKEDIGMSKDQQDNTSTQPRSNLMQQIQIRGGLKTGAGTGAIVATLGANANTDIATAQIAQVRDKKGVWECKVYANTTTVKGWKEKFIPTGCTKATATIVAHSLVG